jgi:hypothetical protein
MTDVARYWDGVPSVDDEPAKRAGLGTLVPSRRTMMKSIVALGGALALNVVSALPPGRPMSASAAGHRASQLRRLQQLFRLQQQHQSLRRLPLQQELLRLRRLVSQGERHLLE